METEWRVRPFTGADARQVCTWHYEGPYGIYDLPDYETARAQGYGVCDPEEQRRNFLAVAEGETLVGYFKLQDRGDHLYLGLGLRPDCTGQGNGGRLMDLVLAQARQRRREVPIRLLVRPFNLRAIRCYERAGFVATGRSVVETDTGPAEMIHMEYRPSQA